MTFLAPWAAWFLAGVPLIVLLYLLKLKRRSAPVSTLMFWQRVLQETRRRALFQKLRQLFSLLLHLLIFALILGALARPVFDHLVREGSSTVLIIDTRARMQARESSGETRLTLAKKRAESLLGQAAGQRQFALLTASAAPTVLAPFTSDDKLLREALRSVSPTDATGDLSAAIHLAEQLLAARQGANRIVVLTAPGVENLKHAGDISANAEVEFVSMGAPHENVAITRFATRPLLTSAQTSEVLVEVANFGKRPVKTNLEFSFDGRRLDVKPVTLEAGARQVQVFPTIPRSGPTARGWLTARLEIDDALASDNVAFAVLPPQQPRRVLLVTNGNWFLEKLLEADQSVRFELLKPEAFKLALATKFDAVILDNVLPGGFALGRSEGNFLFIKQTPFAASGAMLEQPLISETDAQHPVTRLVNLQNVTVVRAAALAEPPHESDWQFATPVRSFDHPLMITGERRTGAATQRVAALALEITDSDLPLRVAFPLLISNTLQWLTGEAAENVQSLLAGETLDLAADQTVSLQPRTEWNSELKPDDAQAAGSFFQPLRNGYYLARRSGASHWMAVNTFTEAESDLRSEAAPVPKASRLVLPSVAGLSGWPLWQHLALAALLLFTLEWWLFHRRRTE